MLATLVERLEARPHAGFHVLRNIGADRPSPECVVGRAVRTVMRTDRTVAWILCLWAALLVTGCASSERTQKTGRVVVEEYRDWTINITPVSSAETRWRARVDISPKGRTAEAQRRIRLHFTESASSEQAIVAAAMQAARSHIDGLHLPRQP
ncbi:MAG TPA: hypothetical protein VIE36_01660 [Methylomirabilota bacterium]